MNFDEFKASTSEDNMPDGLSSGLKALWLEAKGQWDASHDVVNDMPGELGSWIHAYLHRVEGDLSNAGYWYRRANRPASSQPLDQEWAEIARFLTS